MAPDSMHAELQAREVAAVAEGEDAAEKEQLRLRRIGKDPTARTDFLPDKEREAEEAAVRAQLKKEYELRQKACPVSASRQLHVPEAIGLMRAHSQQIILVALLAWACRSAHKAAASW